MTENLVEVDIRTTLKFFDEKAPENRYHATAVVAVAGEDIGTGLFAHYLRQQDLTVEILPWSCTQGTKSGVRLDKWIRTTRKGAVTYYQTEIKNWSAHAIGGKVLKVSTSYNDLAAYKKERWGKQWDGSTFRDKRVRKVLTPMKPPEQGCKVEPLICYWEAMHPKGQREPLFSLRIRNRHFSRVWVFSMSAYLRELLSSGVDKVTIEMPHTVIRAKWLNRLFTLL